LVYAKKTTTKKHNLCKSKQADRGQRGRVGQYETKDKRQ